MICYLVIFFVNTYLLIMNLLAAASNISNMLEQEQHKSVNVAPETPVWIIPQVNRFIGNS